MAGGYHTGQSICKTFPSLEKVPVDRTEEERQGTLHITTCKKHQPEGLCLQTPPLRNTVTQTSTAHFSICQESSELLGMPEKKLNGVYFDVEMPKTRSQDLEGEWPCFPINSCELFFSLLGSSYPILSVWGEKYLKHKNISYWKLLCEGLPTFRLKKKKKKNMLPMCYS